MPISVKKGPKCDLTVVAISAENPNAVARFAAAHLKQGASKVVIYLDRGNTDEFLTVTGKIPDLELISCDDTFWSNTTRPQSVLDRQRYCYDHAYLRVTTTWVGICDIDEVLVPKSTFAQELATAEDSDQLIACPTWEAIWQTGEDDSALFSATHARRAAQNTKADTSQGGALFQVLSRRGLVGHTEGKYIVRSGLPNARLDIHRAWLDGTHIDHKETPIASEKPKIDLLHFDSMSFEAWNKKHHARFESGINVPSNRSSRIAQSQIASLLTTNESRRLLFEALYTVPAEQMRAARKRGRAKRITFDQDVLDFSEFILQQCSSSTPQADRFGSFFSKLFK